MDLSSISSFSQGSFDQARESAARQRLDSLSGTAERAERAGEAAGAGRQDLEGLEEAAGQFEALFVEQMLSAMRDTLNKENRLFDGGMAEGYFEDMLYKEYADTIAKQGDLGIADMIVDQYRSNL